MNCTGLIWFISKDSGINSNRSGDFHLAVVFNVVLEEDISFIRCSERQRRERIEQTTLALWFQTILKAVAR